MYIYVYTRIHTYTYTYIYILVSRAARLYGSNSSSLGRSPCSRSIFVLPRSIARAPLGLLDLFTFSLDLFPSFPSKCISVR